MQYRTQTKDIYTKSLLLTFMEVSQLEKNLKYRNLDDLNIHHFNQKLF